MKPPKKNARKVEATHEKTEVKKSAKSEKTVEFGYYPKPLELTVEGISVSPLPDLSKKVVSVEKSHNVHEGWYYSPATGYQDKLTGKVSRLPFASRVFCLPKTHQLTHKNCDGHRHLDFLVWCLGFFLGMRLTTTEAGFVDATPICASKRAYTDGFMTEQDSNPPFCPQIIFGRSNSSKIPQFPRD